MKKAAFTICAKNYIGLAQVLENSIKAYNNDIDFFIFVADEFATNDLKELPKNVLIAKEVLTIPEDQWYQMCFKYDLTEFCTSIKPLCFKYIFEKLNPESCIYFDPDILIFNSLDYIFEKLARYSIILTPHITSIEAIYSGKLNEQNLLYSGIYNLGFLALKNDEVAHKMLNWWEVRLRDRCYQSGMEHFFTDQKWMDFLPSFFPTELFICTHLGMNLAPWNFYEREVIDLNNTYFVINRLYKEDTTRYPLIFVHFSGFNYNLLLKNEISKCNIKDIIIYDDLIYIFNEYSALLKNSSFSKYINQQYSYNYFSNGVKISLVYRKFFRRLLEDNKITINPFNANAQFYLSLKRNKVIKKQMSENDKSFVNNIDNADRKILLANKFFLILYKIVGAEKYFLIVRLLRLYSKYENHIYIIDRSYFKKFKIWT